MLGLIGKIAFYINFNNMKMKNKSKALKINELYSLVLSKTIDNKEMLNIYHNYNLTDEIQLENKQAEKLFLKLSLNHIVHFIRTAIEIGKYQKLTEIRKSLGIDSHEQ